MIWWLDAALAVPNQPEFSTFEYRGEQVRAVVVTRLVGSQSQQALVRTRRGADPSWAGTNIVAHHALGGGHWHRLFLRCRRAEPLGRPQRACPAQSCGRCCDPAADPAICARFKHRHRRNWCR